jgi:hypothetical protein
MPCAAVEDKVKRHWELVYLRSQYTLPEEAEASHKAAVMVVGTTLQQTSLVARTRISFDGVQRSDEG